MQANLGAGSLIGIDRGSRRGVFYQAFAADRNFPGIYGLQLSDAPEQCAFSRTGWADDRQYAAFFHR